MLTKGAIGNLINRYRAVLKKCHLINTFGSLAVASMLVMGGAGVAEATAVRIGTPVPPAVDSDGNPIPPTESTFYKLNASKEEVYIILPTSATVSETTKHSISTNISDPDDSNKPFSKDFFVSENGTTDAPSFDEATLRDDYNNAIQSTSDVIVAPTVESYKGTGETLTGTDIVTITKENQEYAITPTQKENLISAIQSKYKTDIENTIFNSLDETTKNGIIRDYVSSNYISEQSITDEIERLGNIEWKNVYDREYNNAISSSIYDNKYNEVYEQTKNTKEYKDAYELAYKAYFWMSEEDKKQAAADSVAYILETYADIAAKAECVEHATPIANAAKSTLEAKPETRVTAKTNLIDNYLTNNNTAGAVTDDATADYKSNKITDNQRLAEAENIYKNLLGEGNILVHKEYTCTTKYDGLTEGQDVTATLEGASKTGGSSLFKANSLTVTGNNSGNTGTLTNNTNFNITTSVEVKTGGILNNNGTLNAGGDISILGGKLTNKGTLTAGAVIGNGNSQTIDSSDTNDLKFENAEIENLGASSLKGQNVSITNSKVTNEGTVLADADITISGNIFTNTGTVKADKGIVTLSGDSNGNGTFSNTGKVEAGTNVIVNAGGIFNNGEDIKKTASVTAGKNVTVAEGGEFTNWGSVNAGAVLGANGTPVASATGGNVSVSGTFTNNGTVNAHAGSAADSGNVYVSGTFTNGGTVNADKNVELNGTKFSNTGTVTAGQSVVVKNGTFDNDKVVEATAGNITVSGGTFTNDGTVKFGGSLVVNGNGIFENAGIISKAAGSDAPDLYLSNNGKFSNSAGDLALGNVNFDKGGSYANTGTSTIASVKFTEGGSYKNTGTSTITSMDFNAGGTYTNEANGASTITSLTGTVDNGKGGSLVVSGGEVDIAKAGDGANAAQLGNVSVSGGELDLAAGTLGASELAVSGGTFENDATVNAGSFELSKDGIYHNNKTTSVTNTLTVSGGTFNNNANASVTAGAFQLSGNGTYNNNASTSVTNTLTVSGGTFNNNANAGVTADNIEISGGEFNTVAGSTVAATNNIVIKGGKSDGAEHIVNKGTMTASNKFDLAKGDFTNAGNLYVGNSVNVSSTLTNAGTLGGIAKNPDMVVTGGLSGSISNYDINSTAAGTVINSGKANLGTLNLQGMDIPLSLGASVSVSSSAGSYTNTDGTSTIDKLTTATNITKKDLTELVSTGNDSLDKVINGLINKIGDSNELISIPVGGKLNVEGGTVNIAESGAILQGLTLGKVDANGGLVSSGTLNIGDTVNKGDAEGGHLIALDSAFNGGTLNAHNALVGLAGIDFENTEGLIEKIKGLDLSNILTSLQDLSDEVALNNTAINVSSSKGVISGLADSIVGGLGSLGNGGVTLADADEGSNNQNTTPTTGNSITDTLLGLLGESGALNAVDGVVLFGDSKLNNTDITADNALATLIGGATLQNGSTLTVQNKAIGAALGNVDVQDSSKLTAKDGALLAVIGDLKATNGGDITVTNAKDASTAGSMSTLLVTGATSLTGTDTNTANLDVTGSLAMLNGGLTADTSNIDIAAGGKLLAGDITKILETGEKDAQLTTTNTAITITGNENSLVDTVLGLGENNGEAMGDIGNYLKNSLNVTGAVVMGDAVLNSGSLSATNGFVAVTDDLKVTGLAGSIAADGTVPPGVDLEKSLLYVGDSTTLKGSTVGLDSSVAVLGGNSAVAGLTEVIKLATTGASDGSVNLNNIKEEHFKKLFAALANPSIKTELDGSSLALNKSLVAAVGQLEAKNGSSLGLTESALIMGGDSTLGNTALLLNKSAFAMGGGLTIGEGSADGKGSTDGKGTTDGKAKVEAKSSALLVGDNLTAKDRNASFTDSLLYVGDATKLNNSDLELKSSVAVLGGDVVADATAAAAFKVMNKMAQVDSANLTDPEYVKEALEIYGNAAINKVASLDPATVAAYLAKLKHDTTLDNSNLTLGKADKNAPGSTAMVFGDLYMEGTSSADLTGSSLLVLDDISVKSGALTAKDGSLVAMTGDLTAAAGNDISVTNTSALAVGDILDVTGREVNVTENSALYVGDSTTLTDAPLTLDSSVAVLGGDVLTDPMAAAAWAAVQSSTPIEVQFSKAYVESVIDALIKKLDTKLDKVDKEFVLNYLSANMRDTTLDNSALNVENGSTAAVFGDLVNKRSSPVIVADSNLFVLGETAFNEASNLTAKNANLGIGNCLTVAGGTSTVTDSKLFVGNATTITNGTTLAADNTVAILGGGEVLEEMADVIYDAMKEVVGGLPDGASLSKKNLEALKSEEILAELKAAVVKNLPGASALKELVAKGGNTTVTDANFSATDKSVVAVLGDLTAGKTESGNGSTITLGSSAMGVAGNATLTDTDATAANGSTLFVGKNTKLDNATLTATNSVAVLGGGEAVEQLAKAAVDRENGSISATVDNLIDNLREKYDGLKNAIASILDDSADTTLTGSTLTATNNSVVAVVGDLTAEKSGDTASTITANASSLFVGGDTSLTGSTLAAEGNAANMVAMAGSLKANDSEASVTGSSMFVGNNANLTGSSLALNGSMTMIGGGEVLEEMAAGIYDDIRDAVSQLANGTQLSADAIKAIVVNNLPGAADLKQLVTEGGHATIVDSTLSASNKSLVAVLGNLKAMDTQKDDAAEVALNASAMGVAGKATLSDADATATKSALFVGKNTKLDNATLTADGSVAVLGGGEAVEQMAAALIDRTADGNISVSFDNLATNLQKEYGSLKKALAGILDKSADTTLSDGSKLEAANGSVVAVMGDLAASSKSSVAANASSLFVGGDTSLSGNSTLTANGNAANMVAMAGSLNADASTVSVTGSSLFVGNDTELENASSLTTNGSVAVLGGGEVVERIAQKLYAAAKDAKNGIEEVINDPSKLSLDALVAFVKSNLPTVAEVKKDLTKGGDTTLSDGSTLNATKGSTVTVLGDLTVNTGNTINVTTGSALVGMAHTTVDGTLNVLDSNSSALLWNTVTDADALSGNGTINNAGTFTVADGYVDEFKGTFNQTAGTAYINKEYDNDTDSYFHKEASLNISGGTFVADADKVLNTGWGSLTVGATTYDKVLQYNVTSGNPVDVVANNLKADKDGTLHLDLEGGYYTRTHYTIAKSELAEQALTSGNGGAALVFINGTLITDPNERIMAGGLLSESNTHLTINSLDSTGSAMTVIAGRDISVQTAYDATDSNYRFDPQIGNMLYLVEKDDDHQTLHNLSNVTLSGTKFAANGLIVGDVDKLNIADGAVVTLGGTGDALIGSEATDGTISAITDVDIAVTSGSTLNIGAAGQQARAEGTVGQITADGTLTITNADLTLSEAAGLTSKGTTTVTDSTVNGDTTVSGGSFMADVAATTKSILNGLLTILGGSATLDGTEVTGATSVAANGALTADNASLQAVATAGTFTAKNGTTMTGLEVTGGTANVNGSSVNGNLDVTGGTANVNGSTVTGATSVAANGALTADNASLQDVATAGTFTAKNGTTMTDLTVSGGTANLTGETNSRYNVSLNDLNVSGGLLKITDSNVKVTTLNTNGGSIFVDPSYFEVATLTNSTLNSEFIIGDGSKVSIGGTVAGAPADSNLILGKSIKLGSSGSLLVDPAVKADSTYTAPGAGNAVFAKDSMLAVNASTSDYAITGSGTLTVDADAKLYLNKVAANNTYLIANFDQGATVDGWQQDRTGGTDHTLSDGDNLIVNRTLDALTKVEDGKVTIVTSEAVDSEFMTEALPKNALHELAEEAADVYAKDAGKQFLSRAADSTYMPSEDDAISAINEVTRAAVTAGVQNTALRVSDMAARTVVDHMSLSQHDGSKAIHADGVDFWAAPMYGNLFTSGMVTADSSVRGQFGGLALGMDMESQQILGGKVRVGAALNGGGGQSTAKGNVTSVSNDYNFGGVNVYAGWNKGAFNLIGSLGYGFADHEVDMGLPGSMQMGSAKSDIDTTAVTAELRAEYQFKTAHVDVLPHAGIRYTSLQTDAHDLTVNGAVLNNVKSDTQNIVQFPIGVTFTKDFEAKGWNVKPMADISVIPAAGEKDAHTKVNFSGMDAWDSVNTRIMDSTSWSGTVGVQAEKGNFSLGLNYGVQASSNETDQNIQLKLGWKF